MTKATEAMSPYYHSTSGVSPSSSEPFERVPKPGVAGSIPAEGAARLVTAGFHGVGLVTLAFMNVEITRQDDNHLVVETRGQTLPVHRGVSADDATDGFMASELLLGGLGACMLGTALTFARNTDMPLDDLRVVMDADSAANPERLQTIRITMTATGQLTDRHLASLSRVAARCKIHNTLADPPTVELSLILASQ